MTLPHVGKVCVFTAATPCSCFNTRFGRIGWLFQNTSEKYLSRMCQPTVRHCVSLFLSMNRADLCFVSHELAKVSYQLMSAGVSTATHSNVCQSSSHHSVAALVIQSVLHVIAACMHNLFEDHRHIQLQNA